MNRAVALCVALAAFALAGSARAQDAADAWRELARIDSDAALALIEDSHPGARPEVGDAEFAARLSAAKANLAERLPRVADYPGYAAVMSGLANDFGDGHIWSSAQLSPARLDWAGLIMVRQAKKWVVGRDANEGGELTGQTLLSCDGIDADQLGRERVGQFRANAEVEASMASNAYALLLDDGNPFLTRPASCRFADADGNESERELAWRSAARTALLGQIVEVLQPADAGLGIAQIEGGYWISLDTLGPEADAVATEAEAMQDELRAAPLVVVDLRGNGGGNSAYSARVAAALAGEEQVDSLIMGESACGGEYWRATHDNAGAIRAFAARTDPDSAAWLEALASRVDAAAEEGRGFEPELPACAADASATGGETVAEPGSLAMKGRLVLVTDRSCFSSCLLAADLFRRLGALHVGEATDRSTRYMEVREIMLPSGLRTFSTLQKLALGSGDFGPYEPDLPYPGALADTDALRDWIMHLPESR